ncbi:hypothetical protein [Flavobacterium defluvii]|uniref:Uncharacterized protein n=1 Tax=Flavobacterium defluvii TaxID=370979 RepID=A0A1M5GCM8_9FLAO|nr:hypothetical protein [Flavobacterium defluvii]SHG01540.1 hypothetical protein SAMN05443663_101796 [Flavobacterium defluvii]
MDSRDSLIISLQNRIILLEKQRKSDSTVLNLTTHTIKETQSRLTNLEKNNDSLSKSDYISIFSVLISLISAICIASYFVYNVIKKKQILRRQFLKGSWASEGDIINPQPMPYLSFVIDVDMDDGEITGTFYPNNESYPSVLSVNGKLRLKKAKVQITHISQGKLIIMGMAELKIRGKLLYWKTISGDEELFPKLSYTWKTDSNPDLY